jgi:HlyD family secretion protein
MFHGAVKQVRNAPMSVQNVVTYNVVIGVDNHDLRLKPGMTANVSIVVARRDNVLKLPNAALRFTPPRTSDPMPAADRKPAESPPGAGHASKRVWRLTPSGDPEAVPVEVGISDGAVMELVNGAIKEGDEVVIGMETTRGGRRPDALPPGFGSGQQRRGRDRGL